MKKEKIIAVLNEMFPDAECELNFKTTFELLISVVLSAQTTDKKVNSVTPTLFSRFPDAFALAKGEQIEVQGLIKTLGLSNTKAKNIIELSKILAEKYQGEVPNKKEILITLPGVGNKTANAVLAVGFQLPYFAVDTHVERVSKRLGIAAPKDSVLVVEQKICKYFPKKYWIKLHHQFIFFGRYHCKAQNPNCKECLLKDKCHYYNK